jgi:hypothetical protein
MLVAYTGPRWMRSAVHLPLFRVTLIVKRSPTTRHLQAWRQQDVRVPVQHEEGVADPSVPMRVVLTVVHSAPTA